MNKIIALYVKRYPMIWQIPVLGIVCYIAGIISTKSIRHIIIFIATCFISFFVYVLIKTNKAISLSKFLIYLTIASAFIGPAFFTIDLGPFNIFAFRILLLLISSIFFAQFLLRHGVFNYSNVRIKNYINFLVLWILYSILSLAWADCAEETFKEIIFLVMGSLLIFFTVFYFTKLKDFVLFYYMWLLVLLVMVGLGLWNSMTGNHLDVSGVKDAADRFRYMPTAVFHNPNDFATYLVLSFPFTISFIKHQKIILYRVIGIGLFLSVLYLIVLTKSRANYLALVGGVFFWLIFTLKLKEKIRVLVLFVLLTLLALLLFSQFLQPLYALIVEQYSSLTNEINEGGSINIRVNLIKNSIILLFNHYGFGVGAGNIEYHIANYGKYDTGNVYNLHNWWVELLSNYGIIIFIGYIIFYFNIFRNLFKTYIKLNNKDEKMICEALLIGSACFTVASISSSSIMAQGFHWVFFAFILGYLNFHIINKVKQDRVENK